jgi:hypothetical protein
LALRAPGYVIDPFRVQIDVYDLGMAVMTAWFTLTAPAGLRVKETVKTVKELALLTSDGQGRSPIAEGLQVIVDETVEDYQRAVIRTEVGIRRPSLGQEAPTPDIGRLLWLHPVHMVERVNPTRRLAWELAPVFRQFITVKDAEFASGIGSSAIVAVPGSEDAMIPLRLTELHWAYYALYMALDRGLLGILDRARADGAETAVRKLEEKADEAYQEYLQVVEARARLDSDLSARGVDTLAIWETIAHLQRLRRSRTRSRGR